MNDSVGTGQRASSTKVAARSMEAAHTHTPLLPPLFFPHIMLLVALLFCERQRPRRIMNGNRLLPGLVRLGRLVVGMWIASFFVVC